MSMYKTIVIQIGNSDDKLTQKEWAEFVAQTELVIKDYTTEIHFSGAPGNWELWQNFAWIFLCHINSLETLREKITQTRKRYKQDSVAYSEATTEFI